jgi:tRNA (5-methylaminomethyl-2-thiouridylate)-methyltransferase
MNIAVLVSGGVDSSVALKLLQDQGHLVTAFYLKIWLEDELSYLGDCPWETDLSYVRPLCEQLGIPLEIISLQKEYHQEVVSYAVQEIKAGRTPNPDILCNSRIKFGLFLEAIGNRFENVATGHYAQLAEVNGRYLLMPSPDPIKDQSYFLSHLQQAQLARLMFPIGHMSKSEVRAQAYQYGLPTKDRKDSQGICFLGKLKFSDFVRHYCGTQEGSLVEKETGRVQGTHHGFWFYTIGQRQGLGLAGGPWYVVDKNPTTNTVYISRNYYSEEKKRDTFEIDTVNWFPSTVPPTTQLNVKLRHGPQRYPCTLVAQASGKFMVQLATRDQGIAPGQYAVFYDDTYCLGGGVITRARGDA